MSCGGLTDLRTGTGDEPVTMPETPGEAVVVVVAAAAPPPPLPGISETVLLPLPPLQQPGHTVVSPCLP